MGVFVAIPSGAGVALGVLGKLNLYLPRRYNKRKVPLVNNDVVCKSRLNLMLTLSRLALLV